MALDSGSQCQRVNTRRKWIFKMSVIRFCITCLVLLLFHNLCGAHAFHSHASPQDPDTPEVRDRVYGVNTDNTLLPDPVLSIAAEKALDSSAIEFDRVGLDSRASERRLLVRSLSSAGACECDPVSEYCDDNKECQCKTGFIRSSDGVTCDDIDECAASPNPCQEIVDFEKRNNWPITSVREVDGCKNVPGSYECLCNAGFESSPDKHSCTSINFCLQKDICNTSISECFQMRGDYGCKCKKGYKNVRNEAQHGNPENKDCADVDECNEISTTPCAKIVEEEYRTNNLPQSVLGQHCTNTIGSYICECSDGFVHPGSSTTMCVDRDECKLNVHTCDASNSRCVNTRGDYRCECNPGFTDKDCAPKVCRDIDECKEGVGGDLSVSPCNSQDAECINEERGFKCKCYPGYRDLKKNQRLTAPCPDCCEDIDECENCRDMATCVTKTSECKELCVDGFAKPQNYTCGCKDNRFLDGLYTCYDCEYNDWGPYGDCNVTCGVGTRNRSRRAKGGTLEQTKACNNPLYTVSFITCTMPDCDDKPCSLSPWSEWSKCDVESGPGKQVRKRMILTGASNCGNVSLEEKRDCTVVENSKNWLDSVNWLQIGLGGGFCLVVIAGIFFCLWRRKKSRAIEISHYY